MILNTNELKALISFLGQHECHTIRIRSSATGIGTAWICYCYKCKKEVNITDYDSW
jgi:hypothetical protein